MRQALQSQQVYLLEEVLGEYSALHEVHEHTGIPKPSLDEAIEQSERDRTIRCVQETSPSRGSKGKGEGKGHPWDERVREGARSPTNRKRQSVGAVEYQRYLADKPCLEDEPDVLRVPSHLSYRNPMSVAT